MENTNHKEKQIVLIVDDMPQNLQVLGNILREHGYKVAAAQDGFKALEFVEKRQPDGILLDIMMPGMNGFETCRRLKADEHTRDIPVMFITALTETADILKAFETGGVDYITKPFQVEEVLARVKTHLSLRAAQKQLQIQNAELLRQKKELDLDLQAAASIQRSLLPEKPPELTSARFAWEFLPCSTIGGDIFHIYQLDAFHVALYVLDVSGHGVSSAMVTVPVSQSLSLNPGALLKKPLDTPPYSEIVPPVDVLQGLEQEYPGERFGRYMTSVYLILNIHTGHIRYAKAGHPEPILVRQSGDIELLDATGPMIGMGMGLPFEEKMVTLQPYDRLYLYTDGITEYFNLQREMYGEERLQEELRNTHQKPLEDVCQHVIASVKEYGGDTLPQDDMTLVACEFLGKPES